jgi:hypothetical protein
VSRVRGAGIRNAPGARDQLLVHLVQPHVGELMRLLQPELNRLGAAMFDNANQNRRRPTGLEILAHELNLDVRELAELIGGPWNFAVNHGGPSAGTSDFAETRLPGRVLIGRVGPSVVIQIHDEQVRVGRAKGEWFGPHPLVWDMTDPIVTIPLEEIGARALELGEAVEAACKAKRRSLRVCRHCGELLAPELMFGKAQCYDCASEFAGVVY